MKKILIGVGGLVLIGGIVAGYLLYRSRTLNSRGSVELEQNGLKISVIYNRPSVRGRLIFGRADQEPIREYGKYWRLGANESTEITFRTDVSINGNAVKAGTYKIYAIPGEKTFEIRLNSALGKWGYAEPDHSIDVMKTEVESQTTVSHVELFTIELNPIEGGISMGCRWGIWGIEIPILKAN